MGGSLGGVLWYLHNEIVCHCPKLYGLKNIRRYKVQTRATQPLYDKGMNFGVRHAFDLGKCTGPVWGHDTCDKDAWSRYGYIVGCNDMVNGAFPFPEWRVKYPGAAWYSVPGNCPSQ